jgi:ion channel-forming bestrophin family protein
MIISKRIKISSLWLFAKKNIIQTFLLSTAAVVVYEYLDFKIIAIPFLPIATIGTAVAFYVGFKNNQAYDRLWEARKLWGGFTNVSRNLAANVIALIEDKNIQRDILYRHIGYINLVRLQLRKNISWATNNEDYHKQYVSKSEEIKEFDHAIKELFINLGKEDVFENLKHKGNIANTALKIQFEVIKKLKTEKIIDDFEHNILSLLFEELFNLQGGCERIKSTPLFRQFSLFSRMFVQLFILLLPFGLITELYKIGDHGIWLVVPFSLLISWVFMAMEQIGESSENPFDNGASDTPMSFICRNIEIDIREMLDETDLPPKITPFNEVLL